MDFPLSPITKSAMCCGCGGRVCSCHIDSNEQVGGSHRLKYPSSISFRPWLPAWFDNSDRHKDQSNDICREVASATNDVKQLDERVYPTQRRREYHEVATTIQEDTLPSFTTIGHPSLKIYKFRLPPHLLHLLDEIVDGCSEHADSLSTGWRTFLYSLTKQDIALRDIPGMYETSRPIIHHIKRTIER